LCDCRGSHRILTASNTARVWEPASGKPIIELAGHEAAVNSAAFSPDGMRIVTASADKTARVWDVFPDTQALVSAAKAVVPHCLTPGTQRLLPACRAARLVHRD
jgi:WD40 repeat protein